MLLSRGPLGPSGLVLLSFLGEVCHAAPCLPSGGDGIWAEGEEWSVTDACGLGSACVGRLLLLLLP